jgi:hypothetical protein
MRLFSFYREAIDVGETHSLVPATGLNILPSSAITENFPYQPSYVLRHLSGRFPQGPRPHKYLLFETRFASMQTKTTGFHTTQNYVTVTSAEVS